MNVKLIQRDGITFKMWDLGGASQYRGEWARYTQSVSVLIFVVDASDRASVPTAKVELHRLLEARERATTPILVCANKVDVEPHMKEDEIIKGEACVGPRPRFSFFLSFSRCSLAHRRRTVVPLSFLPLNISHRQS